MTLDWLKIMWTWHAIRTLSLSHTHDLLESATTKHRQTEKRAVFICVTRDARETYHRLYISIPYDVSFAKEIYKRDYILQKRPTCVYISITYRLGIAYFARATWLIHDWFMCDIRLIHVCDRSICVTHVGHALFACITWLSHDSFLCVTSDSFICVTHSDVWHTWGMSYLDVWDETRATCLIHKCDITHVKHALFTCVTWHMWDMSDSHVWHDTCGTCLLHMCDMTNFETCLI